MEILRVSKQTSQYIPQLHKIRDLKIQTQKMEHFLENPQNIAYIAIDRDDVVGLIWGYIQDRMDDNPMFYIHSVDVREDYQNRGIGTLLMKQCLQKAKELNVRNTFLITDKNNTYANKLYKKFTSEIETDKVLYVFK